MIQHTVTPKNLKQNQAGMVSFFVVMIIMAILTLIVIAYAQITRREQRQALDRQLNSQAFYAAETGINDAVEVLRKSESDSLLRRTDYTECSGPNSFEAAGTGINMQLSQENGISYSCLLVDATPRQLSYDNIAVGTSQVIPILPKNGGTVDRLILSWGSVTKANTAQKSGCPARFAVDGANATFQPSPDNCEYAVLRVELVPFSDRTRTRAELIQDRAVYFVQPVSDDEGQPTTVVPPLSYRFTDADQDAQGRVVPVVCSHSQNNYIKRCAVDFTFPNFIGYIRVTSVYHASDLLVTGSNEGGDVEFAGAQAEIDVTGKAGDVLKRIRAYRALGNFTGTPLPEYALQSTKTQCKRFNTDGSSLVVSGAGEGLASICNPNQ